MPTAITLQLCMSESLCWQTQCRKRHRLLVYYSCVCQESLCWQTQCRKRHRLLFYYSCVCQRVWPVWHNAARDTGKPKASLSDLFLLRRMKSGNRGCFINSCSCQRVCSDRHNTARDTDCCFMTAVRFKESARDTNCCFLYGCACQTTLLWQSIFFRQWPTIQRRFCCQWSTVLSGKGNVHFEAFKHSIVSESVFLRRKLVLKTVDRLVI